MQTVFIEYNLADRVMYSNFDKYEDLKSEVKKDFSTMLLDLFPDSVAFLQLNGGEAKINSSAFKLTPTWELANVPLTDTSIYDEFLFLDVEASNESRLFFMFAGIRFNQIEDIFENILKREVRTTFKDYLMKLFFNLHCEQIGVYENVWYDDILAQNGCVFIKENDGLGFLVTASTANLVRILDYFKNYTLKDYSFWDVL